MLRVPGDITTRNLKPLSYKPLMRVSSKLICEQINLRILVRLLKRVIEVLQETADYRDTQSTCQAHPWVCAQADLQHRHCRCYMHQMADMNERAERDKRQRTE